MQYEGKVLRIATAITLTEDVEIPAGYAVYLLNSGSLATAGGGLTVEGTVWVGYGGTLSVPASAAPISVAGDGGIRVVTGGALSIQGLDDGDDDDPATVIGTGKVSIVFMTENRFRNSGE
ncbi:MAG: hypothetical protein LBR93_00550 [Treponema sp.]|jgi:hypothetical protein|nr:hypothetical protein [Treponema sp.]